MTVQTTVVFVAQHELSTSCKSNFHRNLNSTLTGFGYSSFALRSLSYCFTHSVTAPTSRSVRFKLNSVRVQFKKSLENRSTLSRDKSFVYQVYNSIIIKFTLKSLYSHRKWMDIKSSLKTDKKHLKCIISNFFQIILFLFIIGLKLRWNH